VTPTQVEGGAGARLLAGPECVSGVPHPPTVWSMGVNNYAPPAGEATSLQYLQAYVRGFTVRSMRGRWAGGGPILDCQERLGEAGQVVPRHRAGRRLGATATSCGVPVCRQSGDDFLGLFNKVG